MSIAKINRGNAHSIILFGVGLSYYIYEINSIFAHRRNDDVIKTLTSLINEFLCHPKNPP